MSFEITEAFVDEYKDNIQILKAMKTYNDAVVENERRAAYLTRKRKLKGIKTKTLISSPIREVEIEKKPHAVSKIQNGAADEYWSPEEKKPWWRIF